MKSCILNQPHHHWFDLCCSLWVCPQSVRFQTLGQSEQLLMLTVDWERAQSCLSWSCLPPSSLNWWSCQCFHRESKGLFWSPLPLPIFILLWRYRPHLNLLHKPSTPAWLPPALLTAVAALLHWLLSPTLQILPPHRPLLTHLTWTRCINYRGTCLLNPGSTFTRVQSLHIFWAHLCPCFICSCSLFSFLALTSTNV